MNAKLLGESATDVLPLRWTADQQPDGSHQLLNQKMFVGEDVTAQSSFQFTGGRRKTDGLWTSTYDEFGHLSSVESATRRIVYSYDPSGRVVGRDAYSRASGGTWSLESDAAVLEKDGLPASTTWVWDEFTDRLIAVFESGHSTGVSPAPGAGLVRQYVHGDQGYDDAIEISIRQRDGSIERYLPIADEAGNASIHAIADRNGQLVERVFYGDSYGAAPRYVQGPIVDRMVLAVKKDTAGTVKQAKIEVHLSEKIKTEFKTAPVKVRSLSADSGVFFETSGAITVSSDDPYTIVCELTPQDWQKLAQQAGLSTIEVAVTNSIHGEAWGDTSLARAPEWMQKLYGTRSTATEPVIHVESIDALNAYIASLPSGEDEQKKPLYEIADLYMAGSAESKSKLLSGFKAAPFVEPGTGFALFRERWYDPGTGTWLTADPLQYFDSSNAYAYAKGDPVNGADPTGMVAGVDDAAELSYGAWVGINTATDVLIDAGFHNWGDVWNGTDTHFDWKKSFTTNLGVNAVTAGFGGKFKRAGKVAKFVFDVAATAAVNTALNGEPADEALASAVAGHVAGHAVGQIFSAAGRGLRYLSARHEIKFVPPFVTGIGGGAGMLRLSRRQGEVRGLGYHIPTETTDYVNRKGMVWVPEEAPDTGWYRYQSQPVESRVLNGKALVPALLYRNDTIGGYEFVKFDLLRVGDELVDRKLGVSEFGNILSRQEAGFLRMSIALTHNKELGFSGCIEVPNATQLLRVKRSLRRLNITNLTSRISEWQ